MSLADDYVLVRAGTRTPIKVTRRDSFDDLGCFENLLSQLDTGVEFGPFVQVHDTPSTQLANRRWLRIIALLLWLRPSAEPLREVAAWLDRPNGSLGGISPFEATADDEAFAQAYAVAFLTGGRAETQTIETQLLADFCSRHVLGLYSTNRHDSFLSSVFWALHECTGSLTAARLMLTCAPVSGEKSATLYRLVRERCDAETIDEILRTQFRYSGEGVDR